MHTFDTRVTARLRPCKNAVIRLSDVFDNWAVSPMTDVCMKMCSEPTVLLSTHLHAHVNHSGHYMHLMCACKRAVNRLSDVFM